MYSILAGMRLAGNEWLALSWLSAERLCYLRCRNVAEFVLGFEYVHKRSINFATPSYRKFEIIQLQWEESAAKSNKFTASSGLFMHFCDSNHEVTPMQQGGKQHQRAEII